MLIGTFCRFSVRFCEVTVTVSSTTASRSVALCGVVGAAVVASCANAGEAKARQIAAVSGKRLGRAVATRADVTSGAVTSGDGLLPDFCIVLLSPDGRSRKNG